jgi:protein SCO1/2
MLQRRFGPAVTLLSVTVDPDFDTPQVLREYARRWSAAADWRFLTGNVAPLAAALGELYWADEGSIGHNTTTAIIGRDGRLAAIVEGSSFRAEQLAHLIARQLEEHP